MTVLLQVFLFDNLSISIYLNPLVYVAFVALLPLDTPPWCCSHRDWSWA